MLALSATSRSLKFLLSSVLFNYGSVRGAKRGYRGRQNSTRKKKTIDDLVPIKKEKTFVKKKKVVDTNIFVGPKELQEFLQRKPLDNFYLIKKFPPKIYTILEAIDLHKEVASPDIYDNLDGIFYLKMNVNMDSNKKNKPIAPFTGIIHYKNVFEFPMKFNNRILAFAHKPSEQESASDAGAVITGGKDLIKKIIKGIVKKSEFDHVVCTSDIFPEISPLRGILGKGNFPSITKGSVGLNVAELVKRFIKSVTYQTEAVENLIDYSIQLPSDPLYNHISVVECMISKIGMSNEQIIENYNTCIETIMTHKPSTTNKNEFILKICLAAPPNNEVFQLNIEEFLEKDEEILDSQN